MKEKPKKQTCENCGRKYRPAKSWQRFCSTKCRSSEWTDNADRTKKPKTYTFS